MTYCTTTPRARRRSSWSTFVAALLVAVALLVSIGADIVADTLTSTDAVAETIADPTNPED